MRLPVAGQCGSTSRMRDAPTTQVAYIQPSASTDQTNSGGAFTVRLTTAFPASVRPWVDREVVSDIASTFHSAAGCRTLPFPPADRQGAHRPWQYPADRGSHVQVPGRAGSPGPASRVNLLFWGKPDDPSMGHHGAATVVVPGYFAEALLAAG